MVSKQSSVLIVEDEMFLRNMRTSLIAGAFAVEEANSGEEALHRAQHEFFDLVLLDIHMPGIGVEICRRLKDRSPHTGIVAMVTEGDLRGDEVQMLAGVDDYITKPFGVIELIARLRGVIRRARALETPKLAVLQAGTLIMDLNRRAVWRRRRQVHLSPKEFDLLRLMMQNQAAPLTHAHLLRSVWGPESVNMVEYLRSYVYMLRKKIEIDPARPDYILTVPWVGYRFHNPVRSEIV